MCDKNIHNQIIHPSSYECPNVINAYMCCSIRPPLQKTPPPIGYYSPYTAPNTQDYKVQMQKVWFGKPCWAPEGFPCNCETYVLKNSY